MNSLSIVSALGIDPGDEEHLLAEIGRIKHKQERRKRLGELHEELAKLVNATTDPNDVDLTSSVETVPFPQRTQSDILLQSSGGPVQVLVQEASVSVVAKKQKLTNSMLQYATKESQEDFQVRRTAAASCKRGDLVWSV